MKGNGCFAFCGCCLVGGRKSLKKLLRCYGMWPMGIRHVIGFGGSEGEFACRVCLIGWITRFGA